MLLNAENPTLLSLIRPITKPKIWFYLAWVDTINQYRRTVFGPFWILLSLIIFSVAMGTVYSGLFDIAFKQYITYITTGMIGWNWANAILIGTGTIYTANASLLNDYPTNKAYLLWSSVTTQLIIFLHQLPLVIFFFAMGLTPFNHNILYLIPSLIIVFAINLGAGAILAIVVNRYRDLNRILGSLTIIIMLTTPIFWMPNMVGEGARSLAYLLNPFYYIVEIIRDPLLGKAPNPFNYTVASLMALGLLITGSVIHKKYSPFVVFRL
jgi:ABC-type polysaccharide/polyol phosphate export permease